MTFPKSRRVYRYTYDPLDRLSSCGSAQNVMTQQFYNNKRLSTQIQGALKDSVLRTDAFLLGQQRQHAPDDTFLLATDTPGSVLNALSVQSNKGFAYSPYGHRAAEVEGLTLFGFNSECADLVTGHYLLGNGYRAFNPVLMRFNSPDSFSPFGEGGINAYMYCAGDPINRVDLDGHAWTFIKKIRSFFKREPVSKPSFKRGRAPLSGDTPKGILKRKADKISADDFMERDGEEVRLIDFIRKKYTYKHALKSGDFSEKLSAQVAIEYIDKRINNLKKVISLRPEVVRDSTEKIRFDGVEVITYKLDGYKSNKDKAINDFRRGR